MKSEAEILAQAQRKINRGREKRWEAKVAEGATLHGGHLGTCDALFGDPYCNCGKPKNWKAAE